MWRDTLTTYLSMAPMLVSVGITWAALGFGHALGAALPVPEITYAIDMTDDQQVGYLSTIVDSLEDLGVLDSSHTNCYTLDRIVKVQQDLSNGEWKVSINLHLQELVNGKGRPGTADSDIGNADSGSVKGAIGECIGNGGLSLPFPKATGESNNANNDSNNETLIGGNWISNNNSSMPTEAVVQDKEGGLSKTQIMVISTCSTVIGLFFIVALIMRVRNYLKRVRAEQSNRRSAYRSSSIAMRGSSNGSQNSVSQMNGEHLLRYIFADER